MYKKHKLPNCNIENDDSTVKRLRRLLSHSAQCSPFFRERLATLKSGQLASDLDFQRQVPLLQWEDLETIRAATGDPFGGRRCQYDKVHLTFQLENDTELPLYIALSRSELRSYASALTHCWQLLGLGKGDKAAIFDYGSSPLSYLASSSFMPYLSRGAADALGCIPVCNDGVSQMSYRAMEIVRFIRPKVFFIRSDCLFPFFQEAKRQGVSLADHIGAVVVAENDGLISFHSCLDWQKTWGVPVYRLLRVDAAMFLGLECPLCHLLHIPNNLYFVETVSSGRTGGQENISPGQLTITNMFARLTPAIRYVSQVWGLVSKQGCPKGPEDNRVRLL